ncbi:MAG TPA: choice-of-anchor tandem repeat NxxGxxAF-containing protein [Blastocatellia bacterium]|nr:choice-of-anchor tandem repeat NxxGxxAF-containing protein [Blastocatellia bacterium]
MTFAALGKKAILVLAMAAQIILLAMLALAQSNGFVITPIIKRGDPIADGGRFFDCDGCQGRVIGSHAFNNLGDVAIGGDTSGSCFEGRFLISGGQSIRLADFCQQTPYGRFGILGSVNINDRGQAALLVGVPAGSRIDAALFLNTNGQMTKIAQEGDPSPIGTIFKGCGFGQPAINMSGDVAFFACGETQQGFFFGDGVFKYSGGQISKVVTSLDPSPIGGTFALNFIPAQSVQLSDKGDVLFRAGVIIDPTIKEKFGLFLATSEGNKKIEVDGDRMPDGVEIKEGSFGIGDLNNRGEVAFVVGLAGQSDGGIFLYSEGNTNKVVKAGDASPLGGNFSPFDRGPSEPFPLPHINTNGAVAFKAFVTNGSAKSAIFLASTKAIVKVVAVGDHVPTGEKIRGIDTFALNDLGQVAFFAYGTKANTKPLGVYAASPLAPTISKIKLKRKSSGLEFRVDGNHMITNDTVIEINGVALQDLSYPSDFQENGGTTTRVVSRDARLEQLIPEGGAIQVTVYNSLTNLRGVPKVFTR